MIVSLYLRHFKIYKGINFIPLSFGNHFSTIIGENGVGKSSVLEALDFAMNKKDQKDWSVNNEAKSEGNLKANNYPFVAPIFLIPKSLLRNKTVEDKALFDKAEAISDFFWNTKFKTKAKGLDEFYEQRNVLKETYEQDEYFLILIGKTITKTPKLLLVQPITWLFIYPRIYVRQLSGEFNRAICMDAN